MSNSNLGIHRNHVTSRARFFVVLDEAIGEAGRNLAVPEPWPPLPSVMAQLEAMKRATADGRQPTAEERKSITIGQLVTRELTPGPEELYDFKQKLLELAGYFQEWKSDAEVAAFDESDLLSDFDD